MDYYNNILCVSHPELVDRLIPMTTYVNLYNRKQIRVVRRGCNNRPALIEYSSLPEWLKTAVREKYGDPKELAIINPFKQRWEVDTVAADYFSTKILPNGQNLPPEKIHEYTATASALNTMRNLLNDRKAKRKALGGSTKNLLETVVASVKAMQKEYGYVLPKNKKRIQIKLSEYEKLGYESLISGKFGNDNSSKVSDDQQQATLRKLLRDHRNLDNSQVGTLYNIIASNLGWKTITSRTVGLRREEWGLETYGGRRGENAFDNNKAMQVKRKAPSSPLLYWTMDGWDVELLYQKTDLAADGKSVTSYHNRLNAVIILDPCCKYPVGFAIGTHESPALIREALRNAIDHTQEIFGKRFKPHQLQTDRYNNKSLKPFYEAAAATYTPARAKNAKAKVIEPYFKLLNKKYCQLLPNWSGFGVTSNKESQPNDEYLNKIRHSFPDQAECVRQIKRMLLYERKEKYEEYMQLWGALPAEKKLSFSDIDYLYTLGETTGETNRLEGPGLRPTLNGLRREYESFDVDFRRNAAVNWIVRYNPADTKQVLATNADGSIRFLLTEKHTQPMALAERMPGDAAALQAVKNFNKEMKDDIILGMEKDYNIVHDLFVQNPQLNDTLAKLVLIDSIGQYKDRKNELKIIAAARKIAEKQEQKQSNQEEKQFIDQQREYFEQKVDVNKYL